MLIHNSPKKNKKYMVFNNNFGVWVHFGSKCRLGLEPYQSKVINCPSRYKKSMYKKSRYKNKIVSCQIL